MEVGTTASHLSVMRDPSKPLNTSHEYQFSVLEVPTGNHVFSMSTGTPFSIPVTFPDSADASHIRILDFNNKAIYSTSFPADGSWTNLAIQVDWNALTLAAFVSQGALPLKAVIGLLPREGVPSGTARQREFHLGVLKYPIADPKDGANASNTPRFGIQEGSTDGLFFSGVFVEDATTGISAGFDKALPMIT
ncbi:unnamed protein product [Rhizoctonia solani]|uniref:Glycoside hydrolase 131 catalytic N-terminal domain-containing protein n=1 Tax=Rhizoctonia solani TaxID=456999 RepID=A0A8H3DJ53_9AGAM|nr:unnamed protein product [Rhizoctonia solani]